VVLTVCDRLFGTYQAASYSDKNNVKKTDGVSS
jgi:hypothetical protein